MAEAEIKNYELRAILEKRVAEGPLVGVIALSVAENGVVLGRLDVREGFSKSECQSPAIGRALFEKSIKTSVANGWTVLWRGDPVKNGLGASLRY